jgi:hypothetical protein
MIPRHGDWSTTLAMAEQLVETGCGRPSSPVCQFHGTLNQAPARAEPNPDYQRPADTVINPPVQLTSLTGDSRRLGTATR